MVNLARWPLVNLYGLILIQNGRRLALFWVFLLRGGVLNTVLIMFTIYGANLNIQSLRDIRRVSAIVWLFPTPFSTDISFPVVTDSRRIRAHISAFFYFSFEIFHNFLGLHFRNSNFLGFRYLGFYMFLLFYDVANRALFLERDHRACTTARVQFRSWLDQGNTTLGRTESSFGIVASLLFSQRFLPLMIILWGPYHGWYLALNRIVSKDLRIQSQLHHFLVIIQSKILPTLLIFRKSSRSGPR